VRHALKKRAGVMVIVATPREGTQSTQFRPGTSLAEPALTRKALGTPVNPRTIALYAAALAISTVSPIAWAQSKPPADEEEHKSDKTDEDKGEPAEPTPAPKPEPFRSVPSRFELTPYGLLQAQTTSDSTQSFQHGQGNSAIVRSNTYAGQHGRLTMTPRNTIVGFRVKTPEWHSMVASARVEVDFEGAPPTNPPGNALVGSSESGYLTAGPMRVRQAYALLESPYVDFLAGQTQQLFGWGPIFYVNSTNNLGIPGHAFGREFQLKLSHTFKTSGVDLEIAAGAFRPPQRDSQIPDGQAGLRLAVNPWKGIQNGNKVVPLQVALSGTARTFRVQGTNIASATAMPPLQVQSYTESGAGIAIDAFIPVIPADDATKPGNTLSLVGEFAKGYGISDLYQTLSFGLPTQTLALPLNAATYTPPTNLSLDNGIVVFDPNGFLHAVNVQSYIVNLQYVLPGPLDMVGLSGIYSYLESDNIDQLVSPKEKTAGSNTKIFVKMQYTEGNLNVFVTPPLRLSFAYCNTLQTFLDGGQETNHRFIFKVNYSF